jgi:bifunctional non-homologous end joining protein LigD
MAPKRRTKRVSNSKPSLDPAALSNAVRVQRAPAIRPQLATLSESVPAGDQWLHEIKFDGYRFMCYLLRREVRLITRGGHDWTSRFAEIADAIRRVPVDEAILDGELIGFDVQGRPTFNAMQNSLRAGGSRRLQLHLFDLPYCDGYDLRQSPLIERKTLLQKLVGSAAQPALHYSEHVVGHGDDVFNQACERGLEGTISKRLDSHYVSTRTASWLKNKCKQRQEFVIGGFTRSESDRSGLGALVLGYYEAGRLIYCGRVGTGFDRETLQSLYAELVEREQHRTPFAVPPVGADARHVHWVKPELIAEVEFGLWTEDGRLRHATFIRLRTDKRPDEVVRETPLRKSQSRHTAAAAPRRQSMDRRGPTGAGDEIAGVQLSNPQRVMYPQGHRGITKRDVAAYYETIADRILPHIVNRPLTIVRCPKGLPSKCFYQRHLNQTMPAALRSVNVREDDRLVQYIVLDDLAGLISLVQHSTLEIHPWGSQVDSIEQPDRLVFDLDPGPGVSWKRVVEAARSAREVLASIKLQSFVQTSGGKGLHVIVPIVPRAGWPEAKSFCEAVAQFMAKREPSKYTATLSKARRVDRIFVDYLRNGRGATSVAPYSTRARAEATVACPIRWEELSTVRSASAFTLRNVLKRLAALKADPWQGYFALKQHLPAPDL